ncbi:MAG: hypothetical protein U9N42_03060 [Campylobacterota bacterium]|nr:hypothetical protein [Campylobacterota bacterium]
MINFIDRQLIPYIFSFSKQPTLFKELLVANKMYNDGLKLEGNMAGFKISLVKLYATFLLFWNIILLPIVIIFHYVMVKFDIKLDCHLSILLAMIFTMLFFSSFTIYRDWLVQRVALKLIQKGWKNHFPHFGFEKNSQEVSNIYAQALEDGIASRELELYVMNKLLKR